MARWKKVVLLVAGVLVGTPVLFVAVFKSSLWWDNANYARRVFSDLVPYENVLGSRRWSNSVIGCSYAVVELSPAAIDQPPAPREQEPGRPRDPLEKFGGKWQPTPGPDMGNAKGDAPWISCRLSMGEEIYGKLRNATIAPGGWWIAERNTIQVYSPSTRMAFRLSEGD